jgi:hypothetical protein
MRVERFPVDTLRGRSNAKSREAGEMTRHDQELLDKQLSRIDTAPPQGVLMLAIAAVFFAGMALGGFLFAYSDQPPLHLASNDLHTMAQGAQPALPTVR